MEHEPEPKDGIGPAGPDRRRFLRTASSCAMASGLVSGYGMLGAVAVQFLHPANSPPKGWMFVTDLASFPTGGSMNFATPAGQPLVVTRTANPQGEDGFIALSSVCPHLGCMVHWEAHNDRFFCPCHNGAFDPAGNPIAGPPKQSGQPLARYPLKVEGGLLFVEAPVPSEGGADRGNLGVP